MPAALHRLRARTNGGDGFTLVDVERVLGALCDHAVEGYREPYKREVIGLLLGRRTRDGVLVCSTAVPYQARCRARTRCDPNPDALRRRARRLEEERPRLRVLGCYHSHPEEAGSRAWALSPDDREIFYDCGWSAVEVVISVAKTRRFAPRRLNRDGSLSLWRDDGYHFRLSAEAK